jgi:hypothetical protein
VRDGTKHLDMGMSFAENAAARILNIGDEVRFIGHLGLS